jgi:hypothetical protein
VNLIAGRGGTPITCDFKRAAGYIHHHWPPTGLRSPIKALLAAAYYGDNQP